MASKHTTFGIPDGRKGKVRKKVAFLLRFFPDCTCALGRGQHDIGVQEEVIFTTFHWHKRGAIKLAKYLHNIRTVKQPFSKTFLLAFSLFFSYFQHFKFSGRVTYRLWSQLSSLSNAQRNCLWAVAVLKSTSTLSKIERFYCTLVYPCPNNKRDPNAM